MNCLCTGKICIVYYYFLYHHYLDLNQDGYCNVILKLILIKLCLTKFNNDSFLLFMFLDMVLLLYIVYGKL